VELTGRQREIWSFLVDYVDAHGYPPTVREIGEAVGLASPSTVHAHLANLERAGLLASGSDEAARARADRPRPPLRGAQVEIPKLPLLGQVAAGAPLLASTEESAGRRAICSGSSGDSMIEAGIPRRRPLVIVAAARRRGDLAEQRQLRDLDLRRLGGAVAADQLERARLRRIPTQQPGPLEVREVGVHRRGRGEPDRLADLAHRGG